MSTSCSSLASPFPLAASERRSFLRFETVLPVLIEVRGYPMRRCIARNVSRGGIAIELRDPPALGTHLRIWFMTPGGARVAAWGVVKNNYVFNFQAGESSPRQVRGVGIRFIAFEDGDQELLESTLDRIESEIH